MERERTVSRGSLPARASAVARRRGRWRAAATPRRRSRGARRGARCGPRGSSCGRRGCSALMWFGRAPGTRRLRRARADDALLRLRRPARRAGGALGLGLVPDDRARRLRHRERHPQAAFYPLYPLLMRAGGWVVGSPLLAGVLISLACFLGALVLLHRLVALELGSAARAPDAAARRVLPDRAVLLRGLLGGAVPARVGRRLPGRAPGALGVGGAARRARGADAQQRRPAAAAARAAVPLRPARGRRGRRGPRALAAALPPDAAARVAGARAARAGALPRLVGDRARRRARAVPRAGAVDAPPAARSARSRAGSRRRGTGCAS